MSPIPWFLMHTLAWLSIAIAAVATTRLPTQDELKDRQAYYAERFDHYKARMTNAAPH